ncbi:MAG: glycosyltransferase family 2 protein [Candidatus Pacebacteria bacterium]|nr:glycosyltransferase family 2 protein [Candidatus Paceibacterota bacterium]
MWEPRKKFCVIVPAHNEEMMLPNTLRGLIAAGARAEDIYLVDDGSTDNTGDIGREFGVNVLRNDPNIGKALGIERAFEVFNLTNQYDYVALMDADTLVDVDYFTWMLKSFDDPWVVAACGRPISIRYNWLTAYRALCYANGHYIYRKAQGKLGMVCIAPGCSSMYRTSVFKQLDWKGGTVSEDMDVTIQIHHERLGKIAYVVDAKVYTQTPRTLNDYMKQMLRWYTGTWQVIDKRKIYWGTKRVDWECKLLWTEGILTAFWRFAMPIMALMLPFIAHRLSWLADLNVFGHQFHLISQKTLDYYVTLGTPWYSGLLAFGALTVGSYAISLPTTILFAWLERRWDIILYSPTYPFIWYVDVLYFLKGFWRAIIRKGTVKWESPKRYVEKTA